jgi:phosphatidylglycerol---prolipoprotein diacylglyceryl transferase
MFPKLSDLINYLFNTHIDLPIQTYGFFLALGFTFGGIILWSELKRKETEGLLPARTRIVYRGKPVGWFEFISGLLLSAIIGWKFFGIFFNYSEFASNPQKYILSGRGSMAAMIIIAVISTVYHLYKLKRANKTVKEAQEEIIHPYQNTWNIIIVAVISAVIGSKLFDIFDNFGSFLRNPVHSLFSFNGLTFYGGLIVTVIALMFYMRVIKLDWKHVIDSTAPGIIAGYAVGRLGCHFSGDGCWGIVNMLAKPHWIPGWLWASDFPHNIANEGIRIADCGGAHCMVLENPVFPTSLYESLIAAIIFVILWSIRKKIKPPVVLFGTFLILMGIERLIIEQIRVNIKHSILGLQLTQAEIISVLLILGGTGVILYFSKLYNSLKNY